MKLNKLLRMLDNAGIAYRKNLVNDWTLVTLVGGGVSKTWLFYEDGTLAGSW